MFNSISNCQTVLQSANSSLQFHEPYMGSSYSTYSLAFALVSFFNLVISVSVKGYHIVLFSLAFS